MPITKATFFRQTATVIAGVSLMLAYPVFAAESVSAKSVNHAEFDVILHDHVLNGSVNYPAIAQDARFQNYLRSIQSIDATKLPDRNEKLVFWINAYNALAIDGILKGQTPSTFFGKARFFYTTEYDVGGVTTSLYDLEHKILIPLDEPRIHFSIVCASRSCPHLRSEAYTVNRLEQQLEENAVRFINDPERNRFDTEKRIAYLSKIFDWFEKDFERHSGSVLAYIGRYVQDPTVKRGLESGDYKIRYIKYDWSLNGIPLPEG